MRFPLALRFKAVAVSPQVSVTDAGGELVFYVRQKAFKLKEAITVFADVEQTRPLYRIAADRVIDISARYRIEDESGVSLGFLQRRGMRSPAPGGAVLAAARMAWRHAQEQHFAVAGLAVARNPGHHLAGDLRPVHAAEPGEEHPVQPGRGCG